jgi:hypothetical protein
MDGWVRLFRKSLDSAVFDDPVTWKVWTWCLMRATWQPRHEMINGIVVDLEPGQFVFSRRKAANPLKLGVQTIRTCLDRLKSTQSLTLESTQRFTIVTICNWAYYQSGNDATNPQSNPISNPQPTHSQPTANPLTNHEQEEYKKEKKEKKNTIPASPVAENGAGSDCPPPEEASPPPAKKERPARKPRPPDPYFDGVAAIFKLTPAGTGRGRIARLAKFFKERGADLNEIAQRSQTYAARHPTWTWSGEAVEKHWDELGGNGVAPGGRDPRDPDNVNALRDPPHIREEARRGRAAGKPS